MAAPAAASDPGSAPLRRQSPMSQASSQCRFGSSAADAASSASPNPHSQSELTGSAPRSARRALTGCSWSHICSSLISLRTRAPSRPPGSHSRMSCPSASAGSTASHSTAGSQASDHGGRGRRAARIRFPRVTRGATAPAPVLLPRSGPGSIAAPVADGRDRSAGARARRTPSSPPRAAPWRARAPTRPPASAARQVRRFPCDRAATPASRRSMARLAGRATPATRRPPGAATRPRRRLRIATPRGTPGGRVRRAAHPSSGNPAVRRPV